MRTGIDEAMIDGLVRAFYGKARADALLGPVFVERVADWEPHFKRMSEFWSSVASMTGIYHGRLKRPDSEVQLPQAASLASVP